MGYFRELLQSQDSVAAVMRVRSPVVDHTQRIANANFVESWTGQVLAAYTTSDTHRLITFSLSLDDLGNSAADLINNAKATQFDIGGAVWSNIKLLKWDNEAIKLSGMVAI